MQKLANFFATNYPELKGFNRRGLYRMKQFYELYKDNEKVSPLVTQLSWTNHLKIMSACKSMDERIFYMNMCIKERLSKRELERQIDSGYYERYMLSQKPLTPAIEESRRATGNVFLDNYVLDFLDVPETVSERDLQKSMSFGFIRKIKRSSLRSPIAERKSRRVRKRRSLRDFIVSTNRETAAKVVMALDLLSQKAQRSDQRFFCQRPDHILRSILDGLFTAP